MGITNTVGSAIARGSHCGIHINAGAEIGVASTKAYTSQIAAITMMALALSEDSISKRDLRDEVIDALGQLPDQIREVRARPAPPGGGLPAWEGRAHEARASGRPVQRACLPCPRAKQGSGPRGRPACRR